MLSADKFPAVFDSAGWVDVGLKVDAGRWSRWDEIGAVQLGIGWADYSPTISARDARMVALGLALGPEGTGKAPGTEAIDNGRGGLTSGWAWRMGPVGASTGAGWGSLVRVRDSVPAGSSDRAAGPVIVRDAWGHILRTFLTLKNGKPRHDRKADDRALKVAARAARTPEAAAADVARRRGKRADARLRAAAVSAGGLAAGAAD